MDNRIGELIRKLRKTCGMSQMRLADKIGVSYQQVQKYEKGASKLSVPRLIQIAEVFEVPVASFLPPQSLDSKCEPSAESVLSPDEMVMIQLYRRLPRKKLRTAFADMLRDMVSINKKAA